MKPPSDPCAATQEQLLEGAPLTPSQWERLYRHLTDCQDCGAYRDLLGQFTTALEPDPQAQPAPEIAQALGDRVNRLSLWQRLGRGARRPIPAYRALLATAAVALLAVLWEQPQTKHAPPVPSGTSLGQVAFAQADSYLVLDQLQALQQRGRNHREDSLLFRHLSASSDSKDLF